MIELSEVNKSYGKKPVLKNVNLKIDKGAFVMLRGRSGSGKSTLLNIIGGIEPATSGEVTIEGKNVGRLKAKERTDFYRHKVGFIFQGFYLQPQLSILENIGLMGTFAGMARAEREERARELAKQLRIEDILESKPAEISGGQAERACAARALFMHPEIILADEPTNNLDPENARNVIEMLKEIWQGTGATVIVASHDAMVEAYATQIVSVTEGEVRSEASNPKVMQENLEIIENAIREPR